MIGVTAATSGSLYWFFGYISPFIAACTAIGVLLGSRIGTRMLMHVTNRQVRWVFVAILAYLGFRMVLRGLGREGVLPITSLERTMLAVIFTSVIMASLYFIFTYKYRETQDITLSIYQARPENPGRVDLKFINMTSSLLKYGVFISIALLILGLILIFIHGGGLGVSINRIIDPNGHVDTSTITIMSVVIGDIKLDGLSLMLTGLLVLIAIPVIMVALNLIRFAMERDVLYTVLAAITLINLFLAIFVLPTLIIHK